MYLDKWFDKEFFMPSEILAEWSTSRAIRFQCQRLTNESWMFQYAADIPRRLGGDATASELSRDKRQIRQLRHNSQNQLSSWRRTGTHFGVHDNFRPHSEYKRLGAQLDLARWFDLSILDLAAYRYEVVNIGYRAGEAKFANFAAHALTAEIDALNRINNQGGQARSRKG